MELEVCSNNEWWRTFGVLDGAEPEAVDEYVRDLCRALEDAGHAVELSRGQRSMCHGWNGANTFSRNWRGVATFTRVTDAEWAEVERIAGGVPMPAID